MKRTSTARWSEKRRMWRIDVQKDGVRKSIYSAKPGRTGQRAANAKVDAHGAQKQNPDVYPVLPKIQANQILSSTK